MYRILFVLVALVVVVFGSPDTKYTTKYDKVNLDDILNNDRLLEGYCNCLLDKGPCNQDGKDLKDVLPEALQNDCGKCNDVQREGAEKVIRFLFKNKKECFEALEAKYDPNGEYRKRYKHLA